MTPTLVEIGMIAASRDAEDPDEVIAMIAGKKEDAAQCTLIKAFIRTKIQVVLTSSLICPAIEESLIHN